MEKIIAGRHLNLSDNDKNFIIRNLEKIEDEYQKLTSARVVLDVQRNIIYTEVILHGKNIDIEAKAKNNDLRKSVTDAIEKTDKQLKKYLDKVKDHHNNRKFKVEPAEVFDSDTDANSD